MSETPIDQVADEQQTEQDWQQRLLSAEKTLLTALQIYTWRGLALSFNGGKDATVILHLYHDIVQRCPDIREEMQQSNEKIKLVDIVPTQPFQEVSEFVEACQLRYNLEIFKVEAPLKQGLQQFLQRYPSVRAVIMGVRRNDPGAEALQEFSPTDADWPPMMRVNPILHWEYRDVWHYLLSRHIPYCSLYDRGYTSLGSMETTRPNPSLRVTDDCYLPAYHLFDGREERKGRS